MVSFSASIQSKEGKVVWSTTTPNSQSKHTHTQIYPIKEKRKKGGKKIEENPTAQSQT